MKTLGTLLDGFNRRLREAGLELCVPSSPLDADDRQVVVGGLADDSRNLRSGDLFLAVRGQRSDGHAHLHEAIAAGAAAVIVERSEGIGPLPVPVVEVPELGRLRSHLADVFYERPSDTVRCIGVTGTNGKTSTALFIAELATRLGRSTGYLGTLGWGFPGALSESELTTESALIMQARLAALRAQHAEAAAVEVSSHALDQHRVDAVRFDYAVFTNLSRDHLDYHGDLESYGRVKARLFRWPGLKGAVVNVDDPFGAALKTELSALPEVIGFGRGAEAAVRYTLVEALDAGMRTRFDSPWGGAEVLLPLFGAFSAANAAAAIGTLCMAGFDFDAVAAELASVSPVPGRMEFFPGAPTLVVDYAHTPDAVEKMLEALRPHARGRLICLVGCGGDRDRGKRPLMAAAACRHADVVWLTSDNPRSEDPQRILDDMLAGVPEDATVRVEVDRRAAIEAAVAEAVPTDLVVIAGKGHERYQEVAGVRQPFDDRALARELAGSSPASREASCCSG